MGKPQVAAVTTLTRKDHFLMGWHLTKMGWEQAGGRWEGGETIAECASRELQEETGIVLPPEALHHYGYVDRSGDWVALLFIARLPDDQEPRQTEPDGLCDFRWFKVGDDNKIIFPDDIPADRRRLTHGMEAVEQKFGRYIRFSTTNQTLFERLRAVVDKKE